MSWPLWNQTVPQVDMANVGAYTPEQWALMQQQNWQQWSQWQQQYSQWHAQFGDKYTEQMNLSAMAGGAQPPLPPVTQATDVPPPPPDNPPPQPVAPPSITLPYAQTPANYLFPGYNANVAPPAVPSLQATQHPGYPLPDTSKQNYYNAPAVQNYSEYGVDKQTRVAANNIPQGFKANLLTPDRGGVRSNAVFPVDRPSYKTNESPSSGDYRFSNQRRDNDSVDNWRQRDNQSSTRSSTGVENATSSNDPSSHRGPVAGGSDSNKPSNVAPQPKHDFVEEEKQFDLQFKKWEEEFFKWKEHNINHPDKAAYDEYEKTFEACRAQLLERKEQMRLRKLNERSQAVAVVDTDKYLSKGSTQIQHNRFEPHNSQSFDANSDMHADNPYLAGNSPDDESPQDGQNLFPKMFNSTDGIPGLDLVGEKETLTVIPNDSSNSERPLKPDFSAISKGIDNILGDRKLLEMLSIVREKADTTQSNRQFVPSGISRWSNSERENGSDTNNVPMDTGNSPTDCPPGRFDKNFDFQLPNMNQMPPSFNRQQFNSNRISPNRGAGDTLNRNSFHNSMPPNMDRVPGNLPPNQMPWNANQMPGNLPNQYNMNRMSGDFQKTRMPQNMNLQHNNLMTRNPGGMVGNRMPFKSNMLEQSRLGGNNSGPPSLLSLPMVKPNMNMNTGPMNHEKNMQRRSNLNDSFKNDQSQNFNQDYSNNDMEDSVYGKGSEMPMKVEESTSPIWMNFSILEPVIVVDYEHKSDKFSDYDFLEPLEMFDYGHLPTLKAKTPGERGKLPEIDPDRSAAPPARQDRTRAYNDRISDTDDRPKEYDTARNIPREYPERSSNYNQRYGRDERNPERNPERERDYARRDERTRYRNDDRNKDDPERSKDDERTRYRDRSYDRERGFDRRDRRDRRSGSRERNPRKKLAAKDRIADSSVVIVDNPIEVIEIPDDDMVGNTIVMIDDLLEPPGREVRPRKIAIILRGLPGSGKSYLAKLIKEKEIENGGSDLRILSLDDYFISEVENGDNKNQTTESRYQYDKTMEKTYITLLQKSFRRTVSEGFFSFIIVDSANGQLHHFDDMLNAAKMADFKVYLCEMDPDPHSCFKRNIHDRTIEEIQAIKDTWQEVPDGSYLLDATTLLQTAGIDHVQMEDVSDQETADNDDGQPNEEEEVPAPFSSKWDRMDDTDKLALLDGTSKPLRPSASTMEDFLQLDDWNMNKSAQPGKKTVRWADIEEKKEQEKMRAIGFVVGQTNWQRMTDPMQGSGALTQTKYIERVNKKY